jgi:hypothetical protein
MVISDENGLTHTDTVKLFNEIAVGKYEAFTSTYVTDDLDLIISLNFQHIVKRKTKIGTGNINAINNYRAIEIFNPMEVVENEND